MADVASAGHFFDWHELHTPKSSRECATSPKPCAAATESTHDSIWDCSISSVKALERSVHGRQAHALPLDMQVFEDLLGAAEVADAGQLIEDRLTLLRHALHGVPFVMMRLRERGVRAPDAGCGHGPREACALCGYGPQ